MAAVFGLSQLHMEGVAATPARIMMDWLDTHDMIIYSWQDAEFWFTSGQTSRHMEGWKQREQKRGGLFGST